MNIITNFNKNMLKIKFYNIYNTKIIYYNTYKGGHMNKIEIKNLNLKCGKTVIYNKLNLNIIENSYTTIIGPSSSGKTMLFKTIIKGNKAIKVNGSITYTLTDPNKQIVAKTVKKQLQFFLENSGYTKRQITTRINNIIKAFSLESIIDKDPFLLSEGEKQLVVLCSMLVLDLDILLLDNALCRMNQQLKEKVLEHLNKLKKKKVTIVNFTSDISEINNSDYVIMVDKKLIFNKSKKEALSDNKIFEDNNLKLPFLNDITSKLSYYGLIKNNINSIDELVNALWK